MVNDENSLSGEVYLDTLKSSEEASIASLTQQHEHHESIGSQLYLDAHKAQDGYYRERMKKWVSEQDFLVCHRVSLLKTTRSA
mgnify:CR=1 FL=1